MKLVIQKIILILGDVLCMAMAFLLAIEVTQLYHKDITSSEISQFFNFGISKLFGIVILLVFYFQDQYSRRGSFWQELLQIYKTILLMAVINLGLSFVLGKSSLKILIISFWLFFALFIPFGRIVAKKFMLKINVWQRDLYILCSYQNAVDAYELFVKNDLMGYRLKAFVVIDGLNKSSDYIINLAVPIIDKEQLIEQVNWQRDSDIIVAIENEKLYGQVNLINYLQHNCLSVLILPDIKGIALYGANIEHFFGNDQLVMRLNNNLAKKSNIIMKRIFDLALAIPGVILISPIFLIIAVMIKRESNSPVFFAHKRVGRNAREFNCYKFSTMHPNNQEILNELLLNDESARLEWESTYKLHNDPRVTRIGKILRATSLDELPQLINVILGNMSLIGPRPITAEEVDRYGEDIYYYYLVTPGISGLWQVSGRSSLSYQDRVRLDRWYVKNWSLWYDVVVLLKTFAVVIKRDGAY